MQTFMRRLLLTILFLIPFTPLIILDTFALPFVTGPHFAFRLFVELALGVWVMLLLITEREYRPSRPWLLYSLLVLLTATLISDVFGVDPQRSVWGNFSRMDGWVALVHWVLYFLILSSVLKTQKLWRRLFATSLVVSTIISLVAVGQMFGIIPIYRDIIEGRVDGTFGNAGFLASYLLLHIFIALLLIWWKRGKPFAQIGLGVFVILFSVVLYRTATRGALIALLVALISTALLFVITAHKKNRVRVGLFLGGVCICIMGSLFFFIQNSSVLQNTVTIQRFNTLSLSNAQNENRYHLWAIAWEGFKHRPLLGWGQENFYYVYYQYYRPALYNDQEVYSDRAHNIFLDWLVSSGIVGLLAYLLIFGITFTLLWKRVNDRYSRGERCILSGFFIAYIVNGLFLFDSLATYLPLILILAFIHQQNTTSTPDEGIQNRVTLPTLGKILTVAGVTIVCMYIINGRALAATIALAQGIKSFPQQPEYSYDSFLKASRQDSFDTAEVTRQLTVLVVTPEKISQLSPELQTKFRTLTSSEIQRQRSLFPHDPQFPYLAASLAESEGQYTEALHNIEQARALSPHKQTILLKEVGIYLAQKNFSRALQTARETYELAPQFDTPRLTYAIAALYTKQNMLAKQLVTATQESTRMHNDSLLRAYIDTGHKEEAIAMLEYRLTEDPHNTQAYASLAAAYFMVGRNNEAILLIRKAMSIDPQLNQIGEQWINKIGSGINPGE